MLQGVPTMLGGRYRVVERLGRGGMADVYRAEDVVLHRDVAIKVFRGGVERDAHLARFRAEVRTLARLTHPHLVALYDAGGDVAEPWCAMEYVDGGSLGDRDTPLPPAAAARVGAEIAGALGYVHDRGIVHRDVKPSNVLLGRDGGAFLSDFGIARLVDGTRMTQSGLMIGTAAYLSPEQVRGETAGPAADVYALGLVLLEALTGHREYPGTPVESAVSRLSRSPLVPPELGPTWVELLGEMTAAAAADRPDPLTVSQRLALLARALGEVSVPAPERADATPEPAGPTLADAGEEDPAVDGEGPAADGERPAVDGERPAVDGERPAGDGERALPPVVPGPRTPPRSLPVVVLHAVPVGATAVPVAAAPAGAPAPPSQVEWRGRAVVAALRDRIEAQLPDGTRRTGIVLLVAAAVVASFAAVLPLLDSGSRGTPLTTVGATDPTAAPAAAAPGPAEGGPKYLVETLPDGALPVPPTTAWTAGRDGTVAGSTGTARATTASAATARTTATTSAAARPSTSASRTTGPTAVGSPDGTPSGSAGPSTPADGSPNPTGSAAPTGTPSNASTAPRPDGP